MTSEKAIELLHRLQDEQFDGEYGDERREALRMAVKALVDQNLGQKTIDCIIERLDDEDRTTDDLISRQAAIKEIARWSGYLDDDMMGRIQIGLKKLPSAQPQQKIGTCDECIHKDRFDYEPPCKMCIRIASKGRDGDYFWKESD